MPFAGRPLLQMDPNKFPDMFSTFSTDAFMSYGAGAYQWFPFVRSYEFLWWDWILYRQESPTHIVEWKYHICATTFFNRLCPMGLAQTDSYYVESIYCYIMIGLYAQRILNPPKLILGCSIWFTIQVEITQEVKNWYFSV